MVKGAQVLFDAGPADGALHPPTALTGVTPDMRYGLSSAVYTGNGTRGLMVARRLRHGWVHIDSHTIANQPQAPVGGVKDSDSGHSGSDLGAEFFTETRWVTVGAPRARAESARTL